MKRTFYLLFVLTALIMQSCAFDRIEEPKYDIYRVEVGTYLNIRDTPSKKGTILGTINNGALVDVIEITDGWAKVSYRGEEIGYVASDYLVLVRQAKKTEPTEVEATGMEEEETAITEKTPQADSNSGGNVFFIGDSIILASYEKEEIKNRLRSASEYTFIINTVKSVPTGKLFDYAPDLLKELSEELDSSMSWWQRFKSWFGGDSPSDHIVLLSWVKEASLLQAECNGNSLKYLKMSDPEMYFRIQTEIRKDVPDAIAALGLAIDIAGKEYSERSWFIRSQINTGNIFDNICEDWIVENILPRDSFWHKWVLGWIFAIPFKFANWIMTIVHSYLSTLILLMVVLLGLYFLSIHGAVKYQRVGIEKTGVLTLLITPISIIVNVFLWLSMLSLLVYMMPDMSVISVMGQSGYPQRVVREALSEFYSSPITKDWMLILLFLIGTAIVMGINKDHFIAATVPSKVQKFLLNKQKDNLTEEFQDKGLTFEYESWAKMEFPYREMVISEFLGNVGKILITVLPLSFVFNGTLLLYASIFLWTIALKKAIYIGININGLRKQGIYK